MPPRLSSPRTSIFSWWSDSNPGGATVNIHALAKPLMRWMYARAIKKLIAAENDNPMSSELLDIRFSYLASPIVPESSQVLLLSDLNRRALSTEEVVMISASCERHEETFSSLLCGEGIRQIPAVELFFRINIPEAGNRDEFSRRCMASFLGSTTSEE